MQSILSEQQDFVTVKGILISFSSSSETSFVSTRHLCNCLHFASSKDELILPLRPTRMSTNNWTGHVQSLVELVVACPRSPLVSPFSLIHTLFNLIFLFNSTKDELLNPSIFWILCKIEMYKKLLDFLNWRS